MNIYYIFGVRNKWPPLHNFSKRDKINKQDLSELIHFTTTYTQAQTRCSMIRRNLTGLTVFCEQYGVQIFMKHYIVRQWSGVGVHQASDDTLYKLWQICLLLWNLLCSDLRLLGGFHVYCFFIVFISSIHLYIVIRYRVYAILKIKQ